eukprot:498578-Amphidinium_carterae.1
MTMLMLTTISDNNRTAGERQSENLIQKSTKREKTVTSADQSIRPGKTCQGMLCVSMAAQRTCIQLPERKQVQ